MSKCHMRRYFEKYLSCLYIFEKSLSQLYRNISKSLNPYHSAILEHLSNESFNHYKILLNVSKFINLKVQENIKVSECLEISESLKKAFEYLNELKSRNSEQVIEILYKIEEIFEREYPKFLQEFINNIIYSGVSSNTLSRLAELMLVEIKIDESFHVQILNEARKLWIKTKELK